ncbi:M50 family metallopeptidase [Paenibacillus sp. PAMC21692]|uniref:M50 family metallopeptidase n=1 Tax=Paenibacillus sp. PAMC21692 TaxID=2762320 RepID=UPI00164E8377|nr:M50 family metallopeptidase [Paenibacillus sp. PAMC21692]QNK60036.1 M50 family metallopeptidase [Paenibacillus sp. PAMC21692]
MIKWRGIAWSIHPLFVMIMMASAITGYFAELTVLFLSVIVHELGHVFAAKSFGWRIKEVKLLPFGGVAEVEAGGAGAREEALVALAGPLQNVWMGLLAWTCGVTGLWSEPWADYVVQANMMIALFNLLPIHPLDGGKLSHSMISVFLNYYQTLLWSARLSLGFSMIMIAAAAAPLWISGYGDGVQLNLLVVGVFLLLSNWTYYRNVPYLFVRFLTHRRRSALTALDSGKKATPIIVNGYQSILSVAKSLNRERYHLIYVLDPSGKELRVLAEDQIVESCLSGLNPNRAVRELLG